LVVGECNASEGKYIVFRVRHQTRSIPVTVKPKVDPGHLAPDFLAQAGACRQVFGCGQSGEDNGLVGKITVFTFSFDS
jgi:hypothetical protein